MKKAAYFIFMTLSVSLLPWQASAAFFEDKEARRSIIDLRARVNDKADASALLELSKQNEMLRHEVARLRGQVEVITNELRALQQRNRDLYMDLDNRLKHFEPRQLVVDGKNVIVQPDEKQAFDVAEASFAAGNYREAITQYTAFLRRFPQSGLAASAQFGLGNAYFMQKDFKKSIETQAALIKKFPASEQVPEAMLNMASSQIILKELWSARRTLNAIIEKYPDTDTAKKAKQRLDQLG